MKSVFGITLLSGSRATGINFSTTIPGRDFLTETLHDESYLDLTTFAPVEGDLFTTPVGNVPIFTFSESSGDYFTIFNRIVEKKAVASTALIPYLNAKFSFKKTTPDRQKLPQGFNALGASLRAFIRGPTRFYCSNTAFVKEIAASHLASAEPWTHMADVAQADMVILMNPIEMTPTLVDRIDPRAYIITYDEIPQRLLYTFIVKGKFVYIYKKGKVNHDANTFRLVS